MNCKTINLFPFFLMLFFLSCKKDDTSTAEITYEGCCNNPHIETRVGNGKVFIPNLFAPGRQFEQPFTIRTDKNIEEIELLEVRNINNDLIFSKENFLPNNIDEGWVGDNVNDENKGLCSFKTRIRSSDNTVETINGFVCVFYCRGESLDLIIDSYTSCVSGNSHDGEGGFNPSLSSSEDFCGG